MRKLKCLLFLLASLAALVNDVFAKEEVDENFDRLFTTSNERKKLDHAREQGLLYKKSSDLENDLNTNDQKHAANPSAVKMSGIILRADGKAQVWVSGKPLYTSLIQLKANKKTSANLRIPLSGKSISLKPGQVISDGKAKESYYFVTQSSSPSLTIVEVKSVSSSSISSSSVSSQASENAQTKTP